MTYLQAAADFLRDIGVKNVGVNPTQDQMFGMIRGTNGSGNQIIVRVQVKTEWGADVPLKHGNWNQPRYPFGSVQFCLPKPGDGVVNYTHYLIIGSDLRRAVLTPIASIDSASRAWLKVENQMVQTAAVPNYTPKLVFFAKTPGGWVKDPHNVWVKPNPVPLSADDFLNSL